LVDLQERIQTQPKKNQKGTLDWDQLIGRSQIETTQPIPHDDARDDMTLDEVKETPSTLPEAKPFAASSQPHMSLKASEKPDMMAVEPSGMAIKARRKLIPSVLTASRSDLRQAVVWSEILGPPIALRDPSRGNR
jgi:hypothetical protein